MCLKIHLFMYLVFQIHSLDCICISNYIYYDVFVFQIGLYFTSFLISTEYTRPISTLDLAVH